MAVERKGHYRDDVLEVAHALDGALADGGLNVDVEVETRAIVLRLTVFEARTLTARLRP